MCSICYMVSSFSRKVFFFVIIFNLSLFKLIFYLKSCHLLTTSMKCDSAGLKRDGSVFVCNGTAQDTGFHFESLVSFSESMFLSRQFYFAAWYWVNYLLTFLA